MKTYPLHSITIEQAEQKQFHLIDCIMKHFDGNQSINLGDLGCVRELNKPKTTAKAEKVIADFFGAEACELVTGAGTGAIRWAMVASMKPGSNVLVHTAPIYPTSEVTMQGLNLNIIRADFNDKEDIIKVMNDNQIDGALVQHTRQVPTDSYSLDEVIQTIKSVKDVPIIIDDNYAVMKVEKIGVECGADISAFSAFKLQGPEGVGIIVGKKDIIDAVDKMNYSGGSKVQGWQAMEVLRGLTYAPVSLAVQAEQNEKLVKELNSDAIPEIKEAFLANSQSKVLLVEFNEDIAEDILKNAEKLGALPNPVGAESKYELVPMFYKVSGTFLKMDPTLIKRMIRINPNRGGAETILRILKESIRMAKSCS